MQRKRFSLNMGLGVGGGGGEGGNSHSDAYTRHLNYQGYATPPQFTMMSEPINSSLFLSYDWRELSNSPLNGF